MASIFLSDDDLRLLTGYKHPSQQCKWLDANNYIYTTNARKKPRLTIKQVEAREVQQVDQKIEQAPNITRLNQLKNRKSRNA